MTNFHFCLARDIAFVRTLSKEFYQFSLNFENSPVLLLIVVVHMDNTNLSSSAFHQFVLHQARLVFSTSHLLMDSNRNHQMTY